MRSRFIFAAIAVAIPLAVATAEPTVKVNLAKPPPGRYGIEDLWKATVTSDTVCDAWFEGWVFEASRGQVFHATTKPFRLTLGTKVYQYRDVKIDKTETAAGYEVFVTQSGMLPEGDYQFELILVPFGVGDSNEFEVKPTGPPRLIIPREGDTVRVKYPVFNWTPPSPMPKVPVTYELRIWEVLAGQTPEEATAANVPWFEQKNIRATTVTYPSSGRALPDSGMMCWQVAARTSSGQMAASEVRTSWFRSPPLLCPPLFDYGDAPDEDNGAQFHYHTHLTRDGAAHRAYPSSDWQEWLGKVTPLGYAPGLVSVDMESNGLAVDQDKFDDGVLFDCFGFPWDANDKETLIVEISTSGDPSRYAPGKELHLHAWIDWNRDGDWDDPLDHVEWCDVWLLDQTLSPAGPGGVVNSTDFAVQPGGQLWPGYPAARCAAYALVFKTGDMANSNPVATGFWCRFRLSYDDGGLYHQAADYQSLNEPTSSGEVEDYLVPKQPEDAIVVWEHHRTLLFNSDSDIWYADLTRDLVPTPGPLCVLNGVDHDPAVAYDRSGTATVVWARRAPGRRFEVFYSRRKLGGTWATPTSLSNPGGASTTWDDMDPAVAFNDDGTGMCVWVRDKIPSQPAGGDKELYYSLWDGTNWSTAFRHPWNSDAQYSDTVRLPELAYVYSPGTNPVRKAVVVAIHGGNARWVWHSVWDGVSWSAGWIDPMLTAGVAEARSCPYQYYNSGGGQYPSYPARDRLGLASGTSSSARAVAVWTTPSGRLVHSRWNLATWSPILSYAGAISPEPAVAWSPYGEVASLFVKQVGSLFTLYYSKDLVGLGSQFIPTERARRPALAWLGGWPSAAIGVWARQRPSPFWNSSDIYCARWEPALGAWTTPVLVKSLNWGDRNPDIASRSGSHTMIPEQ